MENENLSEWFVEVLIQLTKDQTKEDEKEKRAEEETWKFGKCEETDLTLNCSSSTLELKKMDDVI